MGDLPPTTHLLQVPVRKSFLIDLPFAIATLDTHALPRLYENSDFIFLPQRGCVLQPKVARFGATLGGKATNRNAVAA